MNNSLSQAITIFNQGGIVIFPTDTAYGIGCRMDNYLSIERLFSIRQRPLNQPTPILVDSISTARKYANITTEIEERLLNRNWPGALTVILPVVLPVNEFLIKNNGIGLRIPNHPLLLKLLTTLQVGLLGPSANIHGNVTPYYFKDIDPELKSRVDYIIEGDCILRKESTVISCIQKPWEIIRQGALEIKE